MPGEYEFQSDEEWSEFIQTMKGIVAVMEDGKITINRIGYYDLEDDVDPNHYD